MRVFLLILTALIGYLLGCLNGVILMQLTIQ